MNHIPGHKRVHRSVEAAASDIAEAAIGEVRRAADERRPQKPLPQLVVHASPRSHKNVLPRRASRLTARGCWRRQTGARSSEARVPGLVSPRFYFIDVAVIVIIVVIVIAIVIVVVALTRF